MKQIENVNPFDKHLFFCFVFRESAKFSVIWNLKFLLDVLSVFILEGKFLRPVFITFPPFCWVEQSSVPPFPSWNLQLLSGNSQVSVCWGGHKSTSSFLKMRALNFVAASSAYFFPFLSQALAKSVLENHLDLLLSSGE